MEGSCPARARPVNHVSPRRLDFASDGAVGPHLSRPRQEKPHTLRGLVHGEPQPALQTLADIVMQTVEIFVVEVLK